MAAGNMKLLHVDFVHFRNGFELTNKNVFIHDSFLIVDADEEDQLPTWYNLNDIGYLKGVTTAPGRTGKQPNFVRYL